MDVDLDKKDEDQREGVSMSWWKVKPKVKPKAVSVCLESHLRIFHNLDKHEPNLLQWNYQVPPEKKIVSVKETENEMETTYAMWNKEHHLTASRQDLMQGP